MNKRSICTHTATVESQLNTIVQSIQRFRLISLTKKQESYIQQHIHGMLAHITLYKVKHNKNPSRRHQRCVQTKKTIVACISIGWMYSFVWNEENQEEFNPTILGATASAHSAGFRLFVAYIHRFADNRSDWVCYFKPFPLCTNPGYAFICV